MMCRLHQTKITTLVKQAGGKHHAEAKDKDRQTREESNFFRDEKEDPLHVPHFLEIRC